MTAENAAEMVRMLAPVGGLIRPEPSLVQRARLVRLLHAHLVSDGGYVPRWLAREVQGV